MPPKVRSIVVPTKTIRLEAFDIHGHNGSQPFDYTDFFRFIARLDNERRREQVADRIIALPNFRESKGLFYFSAYAGSSESSFLVLDLREGSEEVRQLEAGKLLATRTVGVIDPIRRIAVVQYVHAGVRAQQIAALFEKLAHIESRDFKGATLEFALRVGEEFRKQVMALDRIKAVSMTLTRPNKDWTDYAQNLTDMASDSNAHNLSLTAAASRNNSLSKSRGAVRVLRELIAGTQRSILKSASVKGTNSDEESIELKLNKQIENKAVKVETENGLPSPAAVSNAATDFLNNLDGQP
jgi:hypothetical protein